MPASSLFDHLVAQALGDYQGLNPIKGQLVICHVCRSGEMVLSAYMDIRSIMRCERLADFLLFIRLSTVDWVAPVVFTLSRSPGAPNATLFEESPTRNSATVPGT